MTQKGSNPFESAFTLLKGLRDQIHDLQAALVHEQQLRAREVDELKAQVQELKKAAHEDREGHGDATRDVKVALSEQASRLASGAEDFRAAITTRLEKLEAALDVEVFDRKQTDQGTQKRINAEAANWRARCDKIERDHSDHKAVFELQGSGAKQRHQELRQDVETLKDLLNNNSLSDDMIRDFCTDLSAHVASSPANTTGRAATATPTQRDGQDVTVRPAKSMSPR